MPNNPSDLILVDQLSKYYRVANKQPGFKGTLKHFFDRKTYDVPAVTDISFKISPGEIVGFLGANGAGKTTLLKMMCGLIHPSTGLVDVGGFSPQRRQAAFLKEITLVMGQKQQLIWDLPPMDSLYVNAAVYGLSDHEAKVRINELADMLELGEELTRPVRKLSLGQRMKSEILAALLHKPSVLFLDEPTLGLDVNAQARVRSFLSEYNKRTGATILLTSHYMADITALCPRVICIHKGRLFYDGDLDSLANSLSPSREVKVELKNSCSSDQFEKYGEIQDLNDRFVCLLVSRDKLTDVVSNLLTDFDIIDLEISDPPIDQLIGKLFIKGEVN